MIEAEISTWVKKSLNELGYGLDSEPEMVRDMPWSQVSRLYTPEGIIYLKISAEPFSNEANLLNYLSKIGVESIPEIIAKNIEKRCFLMKEAGKTLRESLKLNYDLALPSQALTTYSNLQIQCIPKVSTLLDIGVNDWRLNKLPSLYLSFIENTDLLLEDGLSKSDLQALNDFYPKFLSLCESLSSFGMPETLEHGDFQDNNILIHGNKIIVHDFGDASITHPFFSLASFLNSAQRHHGIQENDERYLYLYNHYMKPWNASVPQKTCLNAFKIANRIGHFVFALSFLRIKSCPGIENFPEYNGYISKALKQLTESTA